MISLCRDFYVFMTNLNHSDHLYVFLYGIHQQIESVGEGGGEGGEQ